MFQAIKINNYQNLLATKNNRKVTFIINQFEVSICSSTFSPCIIPDKTLRIVLSLSINIVFCISPASCFANLFLFKTFDNSTIALFIPPPNASIINGVTVILYPGLLSLNSYANCVYFVSFSNRLLQCSAAGDRPYKKSRSFSTPYLPKLSHIFWTYSSFIG